MPDIQVQNVGMSEAPSSVIFNGNLYVFHQGGDNVGTLWYSVMNSNGAWQSDQQVPNVLMEGSPGAIVYNNSIYVFYRSAAYQGQQTWQLYYSIMQADGTWVLNDSIANMGLSASPNPILWNNTIRIFHQGGSNVGQLWYYDMPARH